MKTLTIDEFIEKARKLHGNDYIYSKFRYVNSHTKGIIICPDHGEFNQVPSSHLSGRGCPACGEDKMINNRFLTTEEFIEKARLKHGEKYDYSAVSYNRSNSKVKIICPAHGTFEQTPNSHLNGKGCRECFRVRQSSKECK